MNYLDQIVDRKRREVASRRRFSRFYTSVSKSGSPAECLVRPEGALPHIIAEIKFASPSAGIIRKRVPGETVQIARSYERGGASAISVLCDRSGFSGTPLDLRRVQAVTKLPLLFKEFVLDEVQLYLARAMGASFVLLLVCILEQKLLQRLIEKTRELGMEAVVECASEEELQRALDTSARIIGINARDLRSFKVDPRQASQLIEDIPQAKVAVYMSGVSSKADFEAVTKTRADAVLVGETLMRQDVPEELLARLLRA